MEMYVSPENDGRLKCSFVVDGYIYECLPPQITVSEPRLSYPTRLHNLITKIPLKRKWVGQGEMSKPVRK